MTLTEVLSFTVIATLLVLSPGPNGLLVAKTVPTSGRAAGFANVAGFVTAFYLHGILSVLGVSVILVQSAYAFAIVKYIGAAYLVWIGLKALLSASRVPSTASGDTITARPRNLRRAFLEGLLTNALNPKVSLFYLAAFPQFITLGEQALASSFVLVFIHSLINAVWFGAMVILLSIISNATKGERFQLWLKRTTGVVFIAFGFKLATHKADI